MSLEIMQRVMYHKTDGKYKVLIPSEELQEEMYTKSRSYKKQSE